MNTRKLGKSDVQMTPVLLGTWQAGKAMWTGIDDEEMVRTIRAAYDAGITSIDTAEQYGDGHSEQIVARALADVRDKVVYADKVFANHLKYDEVIEACERSLRNLQTDYIDLYQIHWPSGCWGSDVVPLEETMSALTKLKADGKIRAIGVSNFSAAQLAEASQYGRIDSLQPPYSLFWREIENEVMPYCVEHNIAILAYSSLAQGLLTGKFGRDHQFEEGDHRAKNKLFADRNNYDRVQTALDKLRPVAERNHCTLAQLAIAWLVKQPESFAIVGARSLEQAQDNAKAAELDLSSNDLAEIDRIGRIVTDPLNYGNNVLWEFAGV